MDGMWIIMLPSPSYSLYWLCWFNICSSNRLYQSLLFLRLQNSPQQVTLLAVWMRSLVMWINQCVVLHSLAVEVMNRLAYPLPLRWQWSIGLQWPNISVFTAVIYCFKCIHHCLLSEETFIFVCVFVVCEMQMTWLLLLSFDCHVCTVTLMLLWMSYCYHCILL